MKALRLLLPTLVLAVTSVPALSAPNEDAKLGGHLIAHSTKGVCLLSPAPPCNPGEANLNVDGSLLTAYDLYILVLDGDSEAGVAGASFGIKYNNLPGFGMDVFGWSLCADLDFPGPGGGVAWPDSGSGNVITFAANQNCQSSGASGDEDGGVTAILGSLYVYAYTPDLFEFTARTYVSPPDLKVADCTSVTTDFVVPDHIGSVGFSLAGEDPCTQAEAAMAGGGDPSPDEVWSRVSDEFNLDMLALKRQILLAPERFSPAFQVVPPARVYLPTPDGDYVDAKVWSSSILSPALQAENPGIRTFVVQAGRGITGRIGWTSSGFMGVLHSPEGTYTIDTSRRSGSLRYAVKRFEGFPGINCQTPDSEEAEEFEESGILGAASGIPDYFPYGDSLYVYRIVISADDEYITFFNSDTTEAKNQIVQTLMETNSIYEREAAISLQLVKMIVFDVGQSPFTGISDIYVKKDINQSVADSAVGIGNYELGHLLSQGQNDGNATDNNTVCTSINASAVSSVGDPGSTLMGLGYVPHEAAHQINVFSTPHSNNTFFWDYYSCVQQGRGPEPGNGTTLMGYTAALGTTPLCDPQPKGDAYFNGWNLAFLSKGNQLHHASGCYDAVLLTGNAPPTIEGSIPDQYVPRGTPFELVAPQASDTDSSASLTYCWEQIDPSPGSSSWPEAGPLFRSFPPDTSRARNFPSIGCLLSGQTCAFELLPQHDRDLNFRVTVRDNQIGTGAVAALDTRVVVAGAPFSVTQPNGSETYYPRSAGIVLWDPGDSLLAAMFPTVDIWFFDAAEHEYELLKASTPNDGVQSVTWPDLETTEARVMVRPVGAIYFDISDGSFSLDSSLVAVAPDVPTSHAPLLAVSPNPARSNTLISISMSPGSSQVVAEVYIANLRGSVVRSLYRGVLGPGTSVFQWNGIDGAGRGVGRGIYFIVVDLSTISQRVVQRIVRL